MNGGGVQNYYSWSKNSNGSAATSTTYSTTDLVNEVTDFIEPRVEAGTPWFAWVAFNAPHTPFHDPPAELAPEGGYSAQGAGESNNSHLYRNALEALDTEIGRLLESINPARTQILLLGDNGTPGQVVQAPFGNGNAKGDLYNGGIHVPMVAKGPAVTVAPGSTTDILVHCIDMFSTILELAGIDESAVPGLAARNLGSTSMVPILNGTDSADRFVIAERFGNNPGRAVILADYTDYKYIIYGNPNSTADTPSFEFFNIGAPANDFNEQAPLVIDSLIGVALDAYNACVAKDAEVGGGYSN
jgi:arylsulfatase A-like enzyme